jgi:thioredoxin reductase (NADPH)
MNYEYVATTVFTPLEYGCIGLGEETAIEQLGEENVKVYHSIFKPLEWNFLESHGAEVCYAKVIVNETNRRVVGLHYVGPNAGEVTQGYAVAMKMGMTKEQLDSTVGIHPTTSEVIYIHYIH